MTSLSSLSDRWSPTPKERLTNPDIILECPLLLGRSWVSPPGPTQYFRENKYCLKTVSSYPIIIRGLVRLGFLRIDIFFLFICHKYWVSIDMILTHFLLSCINSTNVFSNNLSSLLFSNLMASSLVK